MVQRPNVQPSSPDRQRGGWVGLRNGWVYGMGGWVGLRNGWMGGFVKVDNRFGYDIWI